MSFTSLDWLQRSGPDDGPSVYGPITLRAYRPAGWTMPPRDAREPWERVTPAEIDAWVAQDATRAKLKRKVAASLAWLARDFGRALLLVLLLVAPAEAAPVEYAISFRQMLGISGAMLDNAGTGTVVADDEGRVLTFHVELLGRTYTEAGFSGLFTFNGAPTAFGGFGTPVARLHEDNGDPFLELKTVAPLDVPIAAVPFVPARALTMGLAWIGDGEYPRLLVNGMMEWFTPTPDRWFIWGATPINDTSAWGTYTLSSATAARSFAATSAPPAIPHAATGVLVAAGLALIRIRATHGKRSVHLVPDHQAWRILYFLTLACGLVRGERVTDAGDAPICQRCAAYAAKRAITHA